jgi:hypothetical protein
MTFYVSLLFILPKSNVPCPILYCSHIHGSPLTNHCKGLYTFSKTVQVDIQYKSSVVTLKSTQVQDSRIWKCGSKSAKPEQTLVARGVLDVSTYLLNKGEGR